MCLGLEQVEDMDHISVRVNGNSMWPTLVDGEIIDFVITEKKFKNGQIVLAKHPFNNDLMIIKRIKSISEKGIFLEGDNPDPTATDDSHNFGLVPKEHVLGIANS
tara:strand:- start:85755 stop:86069 length:315 start_codon:yes stop_codon:yes gene_type:complete